MKERVKYYYFNLKVREDGAKNAKYSCCFGGKKIFRDLRIKQMNCDILLLFEFTFLLGTTFRPQRVETYRDMLPVWAEGSRRWISHSAVRHRSKRLIPYC